MSRRKTITLTALALAVAVAALSPASAPAAAGGSDRPVRGTLSGLTSVNFKTLELMADMTADISHLGEATAHLDADGVLTPNGVVATGTAAFVAANGDQLTGTVTVAGRPSPGDHPVTVAMTVTGGTGRFTDASGTLSTTQLVAPFSFDGVTQRSTSEGPLTGRISY